MAGIEPKNALLPTWLAQQHRVAFRAAAQDLHHPLHLHLSSNDLRSSRIRGLKRGQLEMATGETL